MIDIVDFTEKFKVLKRKSLEVSISNRKIAEKEAKEASETSKPKVYSMEESESSGHQEINSIDSSETRRNKLLNYSIRDYEEWNKKRHDKEVKKDGADLQELAKYTYEKELGRLKKDSHIAINNSSSSRVNKDQKTGKLKIEDNDKLVNKLANDLRQTTMEKYLARKKEMERAEVRATQGGYINEKNKQFNEKLERQLKNAES